MQCAICKKQITPPQKTAYTKGNHGFIVHDECLRACDMCGELLPLEKTIGVDLVCDEQDNPIILYACEKCDPFTWKHANLIQRQQQLIDDNEIYC